MHLSIGLHTSAGKSYPQPLQPAKHRGIAPDINQRLRTDRPNYLSTSRSEGRFFAPWGEKYPLAEGGKRSLFYELLKSPTDSYYQQRNTHHFHTKSTSYLTASYPPPPQIKKVTSTGQQANQYYSPYRTSTAHTSDQYWFRI